MELLTQPKLLFLDSPTSGLDSVAALSVCTRLKYLAENNICTVIATIMQPQVQEVENGWWGRRKVEVEGMEVFFRFKNFYSLQIFVSAAEEGGRANDKARERGGKDSEALIVSS
jgi:ABC-type transporter Mla maintaining outer membrane lipid asymmetry ATPase subunit MlaF